MPQFFFSTSVKWSLRLIWSHPGLLRVLLLPEQEGLVLHGGGVGRRGRRGRRARVGRGGRGGGQRRLLRPQRLVAQAKEKKVYADIYISECM